MTPFLFITLAIIVSLLFRLLAGGMDHDRIRRYVEERGGRVIDSNWAPFGPGWYGEKSDRIYVVRYVDFEGNEHEAHSKTSLWTGVYFTQDRIVRPAKPPVGDRDAVPGLEEENRQLRNEIDRLRRGRG